MLISFSKKFIFVHNPKTGGTSICRALNKYLPFFLKHRHIFSKTPEFMRKNLFPIQNKLIYSDYYFHPKASQLIQLFPEKRYNTYFKFGFVRNPWDLVVSYYFYFKNYKYDKSWFILNEELAKVVYITEHVKKCCFEEYVEWIVCESKEKDENFLTHQKDFFYDKDGNKLVDFIGKFENLNEDFHYIANQIGLKNVELPHKNKSSHKHYREYYNDHTRKLVEEYFKDDIELFGYEF